MRMITVCSCPLLTFVNKFRTSAELLHQAGMLRSTGVKVLGCLVIICVFLVRTSCFSENRTLPKLAGWFVPQFPRILCAGPRTSQVSPPSCRFVPQFPRILCSGPRTSQVSPPSCRFVPQFPRILWCRSPQFTRVSTLLQVCVTVPFNAGEALLLQIFFNAIAFDG